MRQFTDLFFELDATTRTSEKVLALSKYFASADPSDAAWALYFLAGRKVKRAVSTRLLRDWLAEETGLAPWLIDESYDAVGDLAETLALLLPATEQTAALSLHEAIHDRVLPLRSLPLEEQRALVLRTWREMDARERLVWHKLILGEFRVGVAATLVARSLAEVAGVSPAVMAHRLMGDWQPTSAGFRALLAGEDAASHVGRPYPFFLAHPLEGTPESLGEIADWQSEWKWDGIRAQLIRRQGAVLVWSRGEELITDRFPEVREVGEALPDGVVLDGEIVAWRDEAPLPFAILQKRIGRKQVSAKLRAEAPTAFIAYDLLELGGEDIRNLPLDERRPRLESLIASLPRSVPVRLSPLVIAGSWDELHAQYRVARENKVEGLMLKRRASPYGVGRPRGSWWKWKATPLSIDAVLIYAQPGHGRRASLYTDYTFGVWDQGELVPVAKAYSGLTDSEIREVDAFVRRNTLERFGPVRVVRPELVFELHFDAVQVSTRHKSGLAVRFPRMHRWRRDKGPADADSLPTVRGLAEHADA